MALSTTEAGLGAAMLDGVAREKDGTGWELLWMSGEP